jgi:thiol-disulfide isomerase/thioredoxin
MRRGQFVRMLATGSLAAFAAQIRAASKPGKPVDLRLSTLDGKRVHLRDYRGKVVVLNFWATWCGPCKHEMPMLVTAEKEYGSRGVIFIGVSLDDSKTRLRIPEFVCTYDVTFLVWTDATGDDLAKLSMGEAVPATAFIDEEGRIVARVSGEIRKDELDERIAWLLSDRKGAAPRSFVQHLERN